MTDAPADFPIPPVIESAARLRNAVARHGTDPTVVNVAADVGKAFIARANAADLGPLQAMALVARLAASLGLITHSVLRRHGAEDPDLADLQAFVIAYTDLIARGIEELAPLAPAAAPSPAADGAAP